MRLGTSVTDPSAEVLRVLRDHVLDDAEHGITAARFEADPLGWQHAAEDWGVLVRGTHATPDEAQAEAEQCRAALVAAGWADQARAGVLAHLDPDTGRWRGGVNLDFGLLPPAVYGTGVPYVLDTSDSPL